MLSANERMCVSGCDGRGMSCMYGFNSVGREGSLIWHSLYSALLWKTCHCIRCMRVFLKDSWQAISLRECWCQCCKSFEWVICVGLCQRPYWCLLWLVKFCGLVWGHSDLRVCIVSVVRSLVVECRALMLCCVGEGGMCFVMLLRISLTIILTGGTINKLACMKQILWGSCWAWVWE